MEAIAIALAAVLVTILTMLAGFAGYRAYARRVQLDSELRDAVVSLGERLGAFTAAAQELKQEYANSGDHLSAVPKLVEGLIRVSQDEVANLEAFKASVDKLASVFLASGADGGGKEGFQPYDEDAATRSFIKGASGASAAGPGGIW